MFLLLTRIYPSTGNEHTVIDVLDSLKGPISSNNDCLACGISVETDETGAICYLEKWLTREALQQHLRSALFDRVLAAMEFSRQPPDVAFYEVNEIGDLNLVEKVRRPN